MKKIISSILLVSIFNFTIVNAQVEFTSQSGANVKITYGDFSHSSNANGPQDDFYGSVAAGYDRADQELARKEKLAQENANNLVYKLDSKFDPKTNIAYRICNRKVCTDYRDSGIDAVVFYPNQFVWAPSLGILNGYFIHVVNKHKLFTADAELQKASLEVLRDYSMPMLEILSQVKSEKGKLLVENRIKDAFINGEVGAEGSFGVKPANIKAAQEKYSLLTSKINWDMNHQFLITDAVAVAVLAVKIVAARSPALMGMDKIGDTRDHVAALAEQIKKTRDPKWYKYAETVLAPLFASIAKAGLTRDGARLEILQDYRFDVLKTITYKSVRNLTTLKMAADHFAFLSITKKAKK